jgi:hypothetical protein
MAKFGFTELEARRFVERELEKAAPSTSFYWESEELEDLLDLLADVMVKLLEANNKKLTDDWNDHLNKAAGGM